MGEIEFEVDAVIARARRVAGLSQRELAGEAGVAPSTVAAIESGTRLPSIGLLCRLLSVAGLRLAVVDEADAEVVPFPSDVIRDNAGRRFPAHLDVQPPDLMPRRVVAFPRYDRQPPKGWYARTPAGAVAPTRDLHRPDHPTEAEVEYRRQRALYGRAAWWPERAAALRAHLGLESADDDD
ncbi:HTH-type transcriptional regulator / antitoxin HipB [Pedococcus dokdonensis]|uniref:HTH-type transcriptional regulator / antitoxin HipB n=1 Tax=Pedococcus dokdonensis TaxID=443156 RepID=A0A1H0QAQ5_9MICO|nr:helix-turn-helix transcriptional regulator [Pedococcus dokdonensis]SDP14453.1 HTH-type transcriptional regulator / antitoxin HipB [Pedococcus dokdonensis]